MLISNNKNNNKNLKKNRTGYICGIVVITSARYNSMPAQSSQQGRDEHSILMPQSKLVFKVGPTHKYLTTFCQLEDETKYESKWQVAYVKCMNTVPVKKPTWSLYVPYVIAVTREGKANEILAGSMTAF
jgi:hypothetical protein